MSSRDSGLLRLQQIYINRRLLVSGAILNMNISERIAYIQLHPSQTLDDADMVLSFADFPQLSTVKIAWETLKGQNIVFVCCITDIQLHSDFHLIFYAQFLFSDHYPRINSCLHLNYLLEQLSMCNPAATFEIDNNYPELAGPQYIDALIDHMLVNSFRDPTIQHFLCTQLPQITFDLKYISRQDKAFYFQSQFDAQVFVIEEDSTYLRQMILSRLQFGDQAVIRTKIAGIYEKKGMDTMQYIIRLKETTDIQVISKSHQYKVCIYKYNAYRKQEAMNQQNFLQLADTESQYIDNLVEKRNQWLRACLALFNIEVGWDYNLDIQLIHNKFLLRLYNNSRAAMAAE